MHAAILAILAAMVMAGPALGATFVYVSNADDGDIGTYTLQPDGALQPGARVKAEKLVMPMAVSPDKRFLFAAVRSKPYRVYGFRIDPKSGALESVGAGPLAESFPYISLDRRGRFLFGASYGANLVSVNPVTVTTLALDERGTLAAHDSVSVLPPESKLVPGMPRGAVGGPNANQAPRN